MAVAAGRAAAAIMAAAASGWHGGWHGGFWGPRVYIGGPFWYPGPYAYPYPVYAPPVYAPPVYAPPVVEEPLPPAYVEPRSPAYWYYCQDPPGYYPYVAYLCRWVATGRARSRARPRRSQRLTAITTRE